MNNSDINLLLDYINLILSIVLIAQFGIGILRISETHKIGTQRLAQTALTILFIGFIVKGILQINVYYLMLSTESNFSILTQALFIENIKNLIVNFCFIVVGVYFAYINEKK